MKQVKDFIIIDNCKIGEAYCKMRLAPADGSILPGMLPGQFVEVAVETPGVLLRRPISINDVDRQANILTLLVRNAGRGTSALIDMKAGERLNLLLPLGNGFSTEAPAGARLILIGGGVGVAPLLYLGKVLKGKGFEPEFLLGARTVGDLLSLDDFKAVGKVHVCTEDGSEGVKGFVTAHPCLSEKATRYYCCGPAPMMKAVAKVARQNGVDCEVSLENMMACGLGACLCCVEKTVKGNVCVCTEGPVFNINELTWE
ncbi:dihydroorotate dehydrogenase electron transfer subunit [uncultured Duncaniella sp.]|uniref:dihydroorotate dehydrogenase electron transfer subunit n=1 Tax=uncultured Duncaniella sp. TaxID=2768039 RepID=UPI0026021F8D|nr:dihydroorotate dehydrogenase electron transfer subunit [uncultured Duncaniella sp.]